MPVFPLGTVALPGIGLPLHVFEPRYRALVHDCLGGDRRFASVLIERGSEVGGGDVRSAVGTVLEIRDAVELADGRWALGCVGTTRVRVERWLPDAPYPRAEVAPAIDIAMTDAAVASIPQLVVALRHVLAMRAQLGEPAAPAGVELDPDPHLALWQVAALCTAGPFDLLRVLGEDDGDRRAALLGRLVQEQAELLEARLA